MQSSSWAIGRIGWGTLLALLALSGPAAAGNAVNTGLQGQGVPESDLLPIAAIGVIIGVDRIVDMCRTTVNVWGDAIGAKIITRLAPDPEEEPKQALG